MSTRNKANSKARSFYDTTERFMAVGVGLADVAEALGVSYGTVKAARLDPSSGSYRKPPKGWERALAKLAQDRGGTLIQMANELASTTEAS